MHQKTFSVRRNSPRPMARRPALLRCLLLLAGAGGFTMPGVANTPATPPSSTTLAVSAPQVQAGTVVTLTASVSSYGPLSPGQVNFCDATATYCSDVHLLGTAQLTSAGTATLRLTPAIGRHSYRAVFAGTGNAQPSSSAAAAVAVTGTVASSTALAVSGSPGSYTLTAVVTGGAAAAPSGTVSFVDTTGIPHVLATGSLAPVSSALSLNSSFTSRGDGAYGIGVGDLNNDGHPDLVIPNLHQDTVTILLGNGDGTFTAGATLPTGANPMSVGVGDFNGDGNADLAVSNLGGQSVSIFLGDGDGNFTADTTLATDQAPRYVTLGDVNGDGNLDVISPNYTGNTVTIWLGLGDGTFRSTPTIQNLAGPASVALGDVNGDGKTDMVIADYDGNSLQVMLGNGDGTFSQITSGPLPVDTPSSVVMGDFNLDGRQDLAVVDTGSNRLTLLLGKGDGTFTAEPAVTTGAAPVFLAVADFNGDGKPDLTLINQQDWTVSTLLGNGDGTFQPATTLRAGYLPFQVATADFNGDGIPDVATANDDGAQAFVFLSSLAETASTTVANISPPGSSAHAVQAQYAGDGVYQRSTSTTAALTAQPDATSVAVTAAATIPYGATVQLAASVLDTRSGQPVSSGAVAFAGPAGAFSTGTVTNGSAVASWHAAQLGSFTLTGSYIPSTQSLAASSGSAGVMVTPALLTLRADNQSRPYGSPNPALTGSLAGVVNGDTLHETFTTSAASTSPVGTYPIVPALSAADPNYAATASNGTLTITQVLPAVTLAQVTAQAGGTLQFQATVTSPTTGTPTGVVQLLEGSVSLGSATLQKGVAVFSVAPSAIAPNAPLGAQYAGDQNFQAAASPVLVAVGGTAGTGGTVSTGITLTPQPGSGAATVSTGASASFSFAVGVADGATFSNPVSFSVTGLPAGATAVFSPGSLAAGAAAQTVTLAVQVPAAASPTGAPPAVSAARISAGHRPGGWKQHLPLALACLVLPIAGSRRARRLSVLLVAVASLAAAGLLTGCGVTVGQFDTQPQTYTLQVTAASGSATQTVQCTLTVQPVLPTAPGQ